MPHYQPLIDYEHEGRVLAMRRYVGPGYVHDVRERFKRRIAGRREQAHG